MPAVALAAMPGRRRATLDVAREIERRGFSGIYCASFGDGLGLCEALAMVTERIRFGTAIAIIYTRHPWEYANTAALVHELSGGRFDFGIGVSHGPVHERFGLKVGKPLADMRRFVADLRSVPRTGGLPPIVLAALREKMVRLAGEIGDGVVFANAARSHLERSLAVLPAEKLARPDFFVGNMIPVCIADDVAAAATVNRRTLETYLQLPNYREYWKQAGYVEEMATIERAVASGTQRDLAGLLPDRWLADTTLFGTAAMVRDGLEAWFDAGMRTPILVPSSAAGNQMQAIQELFAAFE
jgi:alkanesulfonate monooxygenase SsuD/methylene tetrahydromethanopterin reductase-like flavin-dependent oxidoreductase (luciferase family)